MTEYTDGFRARMVERMTGPKRMSANALAQEVGVYEATLSRWLREAATVEDVSKKKPKTKRSPPEGRRSPEWSPEEKVRVVMEAAAVAEPGLGAFLRREGLHEEDLARFRDEVRQAALAGFTASKKPRHDEQNEPGSAKDGAGLSPDGRVFGGRRGVEERVLYTQGALERDEGFVGQFNDDDFGSEEQRPTLVGGHRFRAAVGWGLTLGVCVNTSRKSFSSRRASSRSAATVSSSSPRFMSTR
jgi:transposase-like protein